MKGPLLPPPLSFSPTNPRAAGEDAGRFALARHGILSVVRRELAAAGVAFTAPAVTLPAPQPEPIAIMGA